MRVSIIFSIFTGICVFIVVIFAFFNFNHKSIQQSVPIVNVYGWYGIIPRSVIDDFEKETGVKVHYDVYDNNEIVEAKLLAGSSGYDIIFPSFSPYAARQIAIGLYQEIDFSKLSNFVHIMPEIYEKIGMTTYAIPFFWGTIGLVINAKIVNKAIGDKKLSYDLIFSPKIIKKLAKYGVNFPEEIVDIYYQMLVFLNAKNYDKTTENLQLFITHMQKIRKYIKKFSSHTIINDLLNGEICIGVTSSDNIYRAIRASGSNDIVYILPKGYGSLWVDCICIPKTAKNVKNAYKFINFLLKPEIAKRITEYSGILTTVAENFEEFRNTLDYQNLDLCPLPSEIATFYVPQVSLTKEQQNFDKILTYTWCKIKLNKFK